MRSRTSLYNWGLGKSLLKRCWPLWVMWFAVLILIVPMNLAGDISRYIRYEMADITFETSRCLLEYAVVVMWFAVIAAPAAALLMFSFLYTSRSCGMIASLPVKRESVFVTSFLTGLVPMLLAEVLTAAVTWLVCGGTGYLDTVYIRKWLWIAASSTAAFYGIAVFCAMLTGNIVIMPLAYIGLNVLPYLIYACAGSTLQALLYGYNYRDSKLFTALSPFLGLNTIEVEAGRMYSGGTYTSGSEVTVSNCELLGYYCIAGLLLSVIALLMFRNRRMESAGDTVAICALKPIFKYCAAVGSACAFAPIVNAMLFNNAFGGSVSGVITVISLAVGAFIGYFAAQMIIDKSVKVFGGHWKDFIVLAVIVLALGACCESDLFRFERYVPDAGEVDAVYVEYGGESVFREPESIEKLLEMHRGIIAGKAVNEQPSADYDALGLTYRLKNGKTVSRMYSIRRTVDGTEEINPTLCELAEVINAPEAIASRKKLPEGCTFDDLSYCTIRGYYMTPDGEQQSQQVELSDKWAADFYNNCILPDADDGHMLRIWPVMGEEYESVRSTLYVDYYFERSDGASEWKGFVIYTDAERCCKWIEEHTDLVIQSVGAAESEEGCAVPTVSSAK